MFEARPQQQLPPNDIIPAVAGYSLLIFAPDPTIKPSMIALNEYIAANSFPIVCWRLRDGRAVPITFAPPPDASAARYIFGGGKVYQLDGPQWSNYDQFAQHLLRRWQDARQIKEPAARPPGPLVMKPGETAVILRQ